jgi:hypothetical protein
MREGFTREIPGTMDLDLKTGKLPDPHFPISILCSAIAPLACAWYG